MAEGQGRSSRQELKLLYLRDYFYKYTNSDNPNIFGFAKVIFF